MFGLMKNAGCKSGYSSEWYRHHYCGTCKTLGRLYGQRSRTVLNYDIVFLGEILSLLSQEQPAEWTGSIQSQNCFDLPEVSEIPDSLQYAADVNLLLVELKIEDNKLDNNRLFWKSLGQFFNGPFRKLKKRLIKWDVDIDRVLNWQEENTFLELQPNISGDASEVIDRFSKPSSEITAYLFAKGAEAVGAKKQIDEIHRIGYLFGQLIYELDAYKDFEDDQISRKFNPIAKAYQLSEETLPDNVDYAMVQRLWSIGDQINTMIERFQLPEAVVKQLQSRLNLNLAAALNSADEVCVTNTGIQQSTFPKLVRTTQYFIQETFSFINPLRPSRFVLGYLVVIAVFFGQDLLAVVQPVEPQPQDDNSLIKWVVGFVLALMPAILYKAFEMSSKTLNPEKLGHKFSKLQKQLKRHLNPDPNEKNPNRLKWWAWVLIILGGLLVLFIILIVVAILSAGTGGGCGGGGCGGCGSGCGNSCGSTGCSC